jgi:two-component system sensor histidine kinase QseC
MNTIRAYLVAMVVASFTLVSFLAALNGYRASIDEAQALMDTQLKNTSDILLLNTGVISMVTLPAMAPEAPPLSLDVQFAFQLWDGDVLTIRSSLAPGIPISSLKEGYSYANFSGYRWRTLIKKGAEDHWAIVAERSDLRYILAEKVALESVFPLLAGLPIAAILVWLLVGLGMRPLSNVSQQINLRRSDDLTPIEYDNPPKELVQLIDSTNALLSRLSSSFEREKNFASHAAHELRTPLSALKVHLHNLAEDLPSNHQGLAHSNAAIDRMHHLVEQILDLNRTHPEIIEANFHAIDLHKLVQAVTASAWPQFSARNHSVSLNGDSEYILGDKTLLEILIQNLLSNANKYTHTGGEIEISVARVDDKIILKVADSGCGVPIHKRSAVFERFYRANSSNNDQAKGSGLGLAIVQHIAQLHDATITLDDSPFSSGLQVTVAFPQHKVST